MQPESDPDAPWVSELAAVSAARSIGAIRDGQAEKGLFRQLDQMHREEGRGSYIEIDAPIELYALVRLLRPRHARGGGGLLGRLVGVLPACARAERAGNLALRRSAQTRHSVGCVASEPVLEHPARPFIRLGGPVPSAETMGPADRGQERGPSLAGRGAGEDRPVPVRCAALGPGAFREFSFIDRRFHSGSVALVDHGGTQEICPSLRRWAVRRAAAPIRRERLGLSAFRCP